MDGSIDVLDKDGRLCVISFHSLEDRIVKTFIRENSEGPKLPRGLPITDEELAELKLKSCTLQKISGAIKATDAEISQNPRFAQCRTSRRRPSWEEFIMFNDNTALNLITRT